MRLDKNGAKPSFDAEQQYAFDVLTSGRNVFLSGDAGTGKSYVTRQFISWCADNHKNVVVTAPTGIAALNINGVTIHRAFKAHIGPIVDKLKEVSIVLKKANVVIIDEISMCRMDLFDFIAKQIIYVNQLRRLKNASDIQVVVVGDFFQLPPVCVKDEKDVLNNYYGYDIGYGFAFQAKSWKACNFVNIVLKKSKRQKNGQFIQYLNEARRGTVSSLNWFMQNSSKHEIKNAILLSGTNRAVNEKNRLELSKLNTKSKTYEATEQGEVKDSDKMALDTLELKIDARVMTLINDRDGRFQNGSFGTVCELGSDYVVVDMDEGERVKIEEYTWEILGYATVKENGKSKVERTKIGSFTQIPLKLAWAITIHKSQGQTYDIVNLNPYSWDCGQLYVALSRCKSVENIYFTEPLREKYLKTSKEVIDFYKSIGGY